MNERQLLTIISQGEGVATEFKTCRSRLSRDVYETACAFLNRHGGTILLGVADSGNIQGIEQDTVAQIKKDFVTAINNPQKLYPPAYLSADEVVVEGKPVLRIFVPESSQVHRCNGRIYDRNEDGDLDITDHTRQVADLYHRNQTTYSENKIYPFAGLKDMRSDLIDKCRRLAGVWQDDHPWLGMEDMELLKSAQLYQIDPETGKGGITLAGILLLGNDQLILSAVPHHRTDLILRKIDLDRYDDRDLVRTNLVESYERIIAFAQKYLPGPFFLEGMERISLRDTIFREVASNILIHREYTNAFSAKLIIERGQVRTENSNKPHGFGVLDPANFTSFPKNPVIGAFFREIHRADELGSGMHRMMRYGKTYGGADPEMVEGDVFRIVVKIPEFGPASDGSVTPPVTPPVSKYIRRLLGLLERRGALGNADIRVAFELKDRRRLRETYIKPALAGGLIEMTIPDKPNSRLQKYRLTAKGMAAVRSSELESSTPGGERDEA